MKRNLYCLALLMFAALIGCTSRREQDASHLDAPTSDAEIIRLDSIIADLASVTAVERDSLLTENEKALKYYLYAMGFNDEELASSIKSISQSDFFRAFSPAVNKVYDQSTFQEVKSRVGFTMEHLTQNFPEVVDYEIYTIISPYSQSIIAIDSIMFIATNHYLGADHDAYEGFEPYKRAIKTPEHISYDVAESALAIAYPFQENSETMLINRLLYEGALVNSVLSVTGSNIKDLNGWNDRQYRLLIDNEKNAWQTLIKNDYLYSHDSQISERLLAPAPSTPLLSAEAPGRAGRFIAYKIVKQYMEDNPDVKPSDLLSPEFYNNPGVLKKIRYNPN